ncbi:MAG: helix-turn-helix transcriptional regulator [Pseudomonadales bacterium]|nr:helix-turn-helix transcriptional regulator [Pseudomonadales bacterium]NRA14121.1 helix-turn-helix transcriptional regulator [Oceanospirillaceae bacterium]
MTDSLALEPKNKLKDLAANTTAESPLPLTNELQINACPVGLAIDVIGGKWKVIILYQLRGNKLRFGQIKNNIPNISQKVLARALKELQGDKLVQRIAYAEVPPRVEYQQTPLAQKLNPVLDLLCRWGGDLRDAKLADQ